jgi:hypothetical protein
MRSDMKFLLKRGRDKPYKELETYHSYCFYRSQGLGDAETSLPK